MTTDYFKQNIGKSVVVPEFTPNGVGNTIAAMRQKFQIPQSIVVTQTQYALLQNNNGIFANVFRTISYAPGSVGTLFGLHVYVDDIGDIENLPLIYHT